jgi:hypothetical protein
MSLIFPFSVAVLSKSAVVVTITVSYHCSLDITIAATTTVVIITANTITCFLPVSAVFLSPFFWCRDCFCR